MIRALRRLALAVTIAFVALPPVASAAAMSHTVEVTPFRLTEVVRPGGTLVYGTNPCPFTVTIHHHGTFVTTTYFDREGTPIRQLGRSLGFTETYSANGRSLTTKSTASVRIEVVDGEITITGRGSQRHLTVPGAGLVLADAGRFVSSLHGLLSIAGLHMPAGSEFCAALSP